MLDVPLVFVFTAGVVSFLSPCILPIIPGFLAYLATSSVKNSQDQAKPSRFAIFLSSVFFVLGFSVVFAALGVLLNSILINIAYTVQTWLAYIGGTIIIIFGLYLTELIKIPFLEKDHKLAVKHKFASTHITSFVFGAAFAVGWTPCVGAVLGAILGLAVSQPGSAFWLLMTYSLGLGIPFLLVGLFADQANKLITRYAGILRYISIAFGFVLIIIGILVFTQNLSAIASFGFLNQLLL